MAVLRRCVVAVGALAPAASALVVTLSSGASSAHAEWPQEPAAPAPSAVWPPSDWPSKAELAAELATPAARAAPECLPEGQLVFVHVMKTAGLSVDDFLDRACKEHPHALCAVRRYDGTRGVEGSPQCITPRFSERRCAAKPSICTIHKSMIYVADEVVCGPAFRRAKFFTIMREPVSRVWSFFNYIAQKGYTPFRERSLKSILQKYETEDLNQGLTAKQRCGWCPMELSNSITRQWFCAHREHCSTTTVEEGMELLRKLDAIIDVRAVGRFPEIAHERGLFLQHPSLSGNTSLSIEATNQAEYSKGAAPDEATKELIAALNADDISLYYYSKTLPTWSTL